MAQQIVMPTQPSRTQSTIIFAIIGVLLVGVAAGGVWLAKQRSQQLATTAKPAQTATKDSGQSTAKPSQTERGQQTPPSTPPTSNSGAQTPPPATTTPSNSSPSTPAPATTPAPQVPATGPSHIPSTGPDDIAFFVGALALGGVTYLALRSWQNRSLSTTT